jgi:dethiobiotin synthetase
MNKGIFITGTDTGVGKTMVTAGLLRWLRQRGVDAVPVKPVQTGAEKRDGKLIAPDLEFSLAISGYRPSEGEIGLMSPYLYEPSCSPHLAGRIAHNYPEIPKIIDCCDKLLASHRAVLVEGAGGIMVPLNERQTMLDLMIALNYPVLLVARFGLGTINHTLLSVRVLRSSGLDLLGVVFNRSEPGLPGNRFIEDDNPVAVANFGSIPVLGKLRYFENSKFDQNDSWRQFEADMPGLDAILASILT